MLYGRFLILFILTVLFIFLSGSESYGGKAEDEYHGVYVVSSCRNFDDATALVDRLRAMGYDSFYKTVNIPNKGKWHRVFVRKYNDREEALLAGKELREKGVIKSFIIVKAEPENKTAASHRNAKENESISPPSVLTEGKAAPPNIEEAAPPNIEEAALPNIEEAAPPNIEEAAPPHKDKADLYPKTEKTPYDSAMSDFMSGKYEEALSKFKELMKTERNEAVIRRIADCYYFLGEKGDEQYILEAIDRYRGILRNYHCQKKNAQVLYRLAESYSRLNFHHEALMEFKNLYLKYPESDYMPESLFMAGKMYYKTGRFSGAIDKFKEYIKRFPDGKRARDAYFGIGDCYSQMRQFNDADVWYGNALKKWPALEDIPEDALLRLGSHYFKTGKYDNALRFFFVYLNLFPEGEHRKDTLYNIARSFEAMGQVRSALMALSLVVERYPGSRKAKESALVMANIGVKYPEMKLPLYILPGMDYYADPIGTYEKMAGKFSDPDMEEELIFRKGEALIKKGRYREAFDNYNLLLNKFPHGTHRREGERKLVLSAGLLIDEYYSEKDCIAVLDVYFNSDKDALFKNGDFDMLLKIGSSLKETGLLNSAAKFFGEMIGVFEKDKRISEILLKMAEIDYNRGYYEDAKKRLKGLYGDQSEVDKRTVIAAMKLLGDVYYEEGLFKEAAGYYSKVLGFEAVIGDQMSDVRKKYAGSLRRMGMYSSALVNYKRVLKNCGGGGEDSVITGSYEGAGDCLYSKGEYQQAITMYKQSLENVSEGEQNMWILFNIGRGYANLGNKPIADKFFSSLKEKGGDEFWSRVVDYYLADKNWIEKHGRLGSKN